MVFCARSLHAFGHRTIQIYVNASSTPSPTASTIAMADTEVDAVTMLTQIIAQQDSTRSKSLVSKDVSPRRKPSSDIAIHQLDHLKTRNTFSNTRSTRTSPNARTVISRSPSTHYTGLCNSPKSAPSTQRHPGSLFRPSLRRANFLIWPIHTNPSAAIIHPPAAR